MTIKNLSNSVDSDVRSSNVHNPDIHNPDIHNKGGMVSSGNSASSKVSREFHRFLADIEELVKATTSLSGDDLEHAKARLGERIESAKKNIEEMSGAISDQARSGVKATDTYVHEHPWRAIGIGAAVSLLAGMLLARRS